LLLRYERYSNRIIMPDRISTGILPFFSAALRIWAERGQKGHVAVDFSRVEKAFANGMLGVIAKIEDLRHQGVAVVIMLPSDPIAREFFFTTNWANLLDPVYPRAAKRKKNHFVQHFTSFGELPEMVNNFMDVVLRYIYMPRDIQSALEWSV